MGFKGSKSYSASFHMGPQILGGKLLNSVTCVVEIRALLMIHSYNVNLQKHAVDFYISDFQSGLRALVKAGYGARVIPYVDETIAMEVDPRKKDSSPELIQWLGERNLSVSDRLMRLKEG